MQQELEVQCESCGRVLATIKNNGIDVALVLKSMRFTCECGLEVNPAQDDVIDLPDDDLNP